MKRRSWKMMLSGMLAAVMVMTTVTTSAFAADFPADEEALIEEEAEVLAADDFSEDAYAEDEIYVEEAAPAEDDYYEDAEAAEEITDAEDAEEILPDETEDVIGEEDFLYEEDAPAVLVEEDAVSEEALSEEALFTGIEADALPAAEDADVSDEEEDFEAAEEDVFEPALGGVIEGTGHTDRETAIPINLNERYKATITNTASRYYYYEFKVTKPTKIYISLASEDIDSIWFDFLCWDDQFKEYMPLTGYGEKPSVGAGGKNAVGWQFKPMYAPWKKYQGTTTTLIKGTYYIFFTNVGAGSYDFMVSTYAPKKVKSMKLNKKEAALLTGATLELKATVSPSKAYDPSVTWVSDKPEIASVDSVTGVVTANKEGEATIFAVTKAANSKGKQLEKTCKVTVVGGTYESNYDDVHPKGLITKQKITLYDVANPVYFKKAYDKYTIEEGKKYGSIKNGVFTSKKAGLIHIKGYVKANKNLYVEAASLTLYVETPKIMYPEGAKKLTVTQRGKVINSVEMFNASETEIIPTSYSIKTSKKDKNSFTLFEDGTLTVHATGKCTITACFGEGSNAAKYSFKVSATIPKYKKAAVTVKEGSTTTVTIEKVAKDKVPAWSVVGYDVENRQIGGSSGGYFKWTTTKSKSKTSHSMKIEGLSPGTDVLLALIDGVYYECVITVVPKS